MIRSDPAEAVVFLDEERIGVTPLEVPFVFYGTRRIVLEKEGHQTFVVEEEFKAPWYQHFPIGLFFEAVYPFTLTDRREVEYPLILIPPEPDEAGLSPEDLSKIIQRSQEMAKDLEKKRLKEEK